MIGDKFVVVCGRKMVTITVEGDGFHNRYSGAGGRQSDIVWGTMREAMRRASYRVRTLARRTGGDDRALSLPMNVYRAADVVTITVGKVADWQGVKGMHVARVLQADGVCKFAVSGHSVRHVIDNARQWADERGLFVIEEIVKG